MHALQVPKKNLLQLCLAKAMETEPFAFRIEALLSPNSCNSGTFLKRLSFVLFTIFWNLWKLKLTNNHQAKPHVHQQHIVLATTFRSGLPQPLSNQMARRERKPTNMQLHFFASRTNWKIYVVRPGVDVRLKFFLGVWMRVGNYETS